MNIVDEIKAKYPNGTRIELIKMVDIQSVPSGTKGTVDFVDDMGTIHMKWDNGRRLGLIEEIDEFKIIKEEDEMNNFKFNQELADFIKEGLKQIQWLDNADCIDKGDIDDVLCCLKDHFEGSKFAKGNEGEDYDEWYDDFCEETLMHYFERM